MDFIIIFLLLALVAEIIGTVGGFGSSLLFVPLASLFFDFHSVLGITAIFHLSSNVSKIYFFRKGYDKNLILKMGIPAILFVFIGSLLSKHFDSMILEFALGIFLLTMSLLLLIFKRLQIKPNTTNAISGGILSGFIAGLLGTGGAIRGITMAAFGLSTEVFIATSAIIDLGIDFTRSIVYTANGYVHAHDLYLIPLLLLVSIVGTFLGKKILSKMTQSQFRKGVLILVLLTGLATVIKITYPFFNLN